MEKTVRATEYPTGKTNKPKVLTSQCKIHKPSTWSVNPLYTHEIQGNLDKNGN